LRVVKIYPPEYCMNMKNLSVRRLVRCAVIAAVYVVVCLVLAPFSYGAVQVRVAEALCLLPVFGAEYIVGVTLGCFLANLLGSTVVDVVFGTLATLLACLVTYKLRDIRVKGLAIPASLPPVVFNMIIVGAFEITFFFSDGAPTAMLAVFNAVTVGIGELISCTILGVALVKLIESNAGLNKIFTEE
jgi:Predicted membrane protein